MGSPFSSSAILNWCGQSLSDTNPRNPSKPGPKAALPQKNTPSSTTWEKYRACDRQGAERRNPDKRQGFANSIAYYMKLTYSNWHKELVHDDTIQSELNSITDGQLEFTNRPFVRTARITARNATITIPHGCLTARITGTEITAEDRADAITVEDRADVTTGGGQGGRDNRGGNRGFKKRY